MPILDTNMGYRGFCAVDGTGIPHTGSGLEKAPSIIPGEGIHGSAIDSAASRIHWAEGQNAYVGDINTYLFGNFWDILKAWTTSNRITGKDLILSPNGIEVYTYTSAKVNKLTLTSAEGNNLVTVTIGITALTREDAGSAGDYSYFSEDNLNVNPTPYYNTSIDSASINSFGVGTDNDVLSWTINIVNNTITIYVHNASQDPKHSNQGLLEVTGDMRLFNTNGIAFPTTRTGSVDVTLHDFGHIIIPVAALTSAPEPPTGSNDKVVRTLAYTGFGSAADACVKLT